LDTALRFVRGKLEQEAGSSAEPLTDDQRSLLESLPRESTLPVYENSLVMIVPRDLDYQRLCALGKAAYQNDLQNDLRWKRASANHWKFALSVLKLSGHPRSWLLSWAGVKPERPWRDRWLLTGAAMLLVFLLLGLGFLLENPSASLVRKNSVPAAAW
jgi:hypothetical protein